MKISFATFFALILSAGTAGAKVPADLFSRPVFEFRCYSACSAIGNLKAVAAARQSDPSSVAYKVALGVGAVEQAYRRVAPKAPLSVNAVAGLIKKVKAAPDVKKELLDAVRLLDGALSAEPSSYPDAYFAKGAAELACGRFSEALADFYSAMNFGGGPASGRGAFVALMLMWDELSDEQRSEWSEQIAGMMAEAASNSGLNEQLDRALVSDMLDLGAAAKLSRR
jgi:tetratricopeptide (TPR) repeat protein